MLVFSVLKFAVAKRERGLIERYGGQFLAEVNGTTKTPKL